MGQHLWLATKADADTDLACRSWTYHLTRGKTTWTAAS